MANKPKARMASALTNGINDNFDSKLPPHWPDAVASGAREDAALPIPDGASFEPDTIVNESASEVHWPEQPPPQVKTRSTRTHKLARSSAKRKTHAAHTGKQEGPERSGAQQRDRTHAGSGRQARAASRQKAHTALVKPSGTAAH
jgi:hypothetical protein